MAADLSTSVSGSSSLPSASNTNTINHLDSESSSDEEEEKEKTKGIKKERKEGTVRQRPHLISSSSSSSSNGLDGEKTHSDHRDNSANGRSISSYDRSISTTSPLNSPPPLPHNRSLSVFSSASASNLLAQLKRAPSFFSRSNSREGEKAQEAANETKKWMDERMKSMFHEEEEIPFSSLKKPPPTFYSLYYYTRVNILPPFLTLLVLLQLILLPFRLALSTTCSVDGYQYYLYGWACDDRVVEFFTITVVLFTEYIEFVWIEETVAVRINWHANPSLRTTLVLDALSTFPYSSILPHSYSYQLFTDVELATATRVHTLFHLPRLFRLPRLSTFIETIEMHNLISSYVDPTLFRLLKFGVWLFLFAHLSGCGYLFISYAEGLPDNSWVLPPHVRISSPLSQYIHSLYWGFCAMSGNGSYPGDPQTDIEHIFSLIVLFVGVSIFGLLIGNLSSIIQNLNSKSEDFRTKMTDITSLMTDYDLPLTVQSRVKSCLQYLYGYQIDNDSNSLVEQTNDSQERGRGEGWDVLHVLPAYLRNEVLCHVNGEIIHKVPLFRDCSDGFMRSLVPLLKPEVVIPGDYIIRAGEIGRDMYLLRKGQMEVIAHGSVVATLNDGSYVGEVAIIFETKRTASVRAVTFCDVLVLSKADFDGVVSQYPDVQKSMKMQATMRRNARTLQDKQVASSNHSTNVSGSSSSINNATPNGNKPLLRRQGSGGSGLITASKDGVSTPPLYPTKSFTVPSSRRTTLAPSTIHPTVAEGIKSKSAIKDTNKEEEDRNKNSMQHNGNELTRTSNTDNNRSNNGTLPEIEENSVSVGEGEIVGLSQLELKGREKWRLLRLLTKK